MVRNRKASCADREYVAKLASFGVQYAPEPYNYIPAHETHPGSADRRWWKLLDPRGHANAFFEARCDRVFAGKGCLFPGIIKGVKKKVCCDDCDECRPWTIADPTYVDQLARKGFKYAAAPLNAVPASRTFKSCNEIRKWSLLSAKGHANPVFESACSDVKKGRGCPFPGFSPTNSTFCCETCTECRKATIGDPEFVKSLEKRGLKYDDDNRVPATQTFKYTIEKRRWRLLDAKGHLNPVWEAECGSVSKGEGLGCPFPGVCERYPTSVCSVHCSVCRTATVADPDYITKLAVRGIKYAEDNVVPAGETFKGTEDKRRWKLIDSKGHVNPIFEAMCHNILTGRGCPYPEFSDPPQSICSPECIVCRRATLADPEYIEKLASRQCAIAYATDNDVAAGVTFKQSAHPRLWELLDPRGHAYPFFVMTCADVFAGYLPGYANVASRVLYICSVHCTVCVRFTAADPEFIQSLAARGIRYDDAATPAWKVIKKGGQIHQWFHSACQTRWMKSCVAMAQGTGCPTCLTTTEALVRQFVLGWAALANLQLGPISYDWCINVASGRKLRFDIVLCDDRGLPQKIIEVDGDHHFRTGYMYGPSNYNVVEHQVRRDTFKAWCAHIRGIQLVRIAQEDVYGDVWRDWRNALIRALESSDDACYLSIDPNVYQRHEKAMRDAIAQGFAPPYHIDTTPEGDDVWFEDEEETEPTNSGEASNVAEVVGAQEAGPILKRRRGLNE